MATGAVMGGVGAGAVIITDGAEVIAVITMVGHAAAIAAGAKTNNGEAALSWRLHPSSPKTFSR
jgi:hypothetical protein